MKEQKIINRAYKVRLYPNQTQINLIERTFGCCRVVYNEYVAWKKKYMGVSKEDCIPFSEKGLKVEKLYLKEVSSQALQQARRDGEQAFRNYFKNPKHFREPKFHSKKDTKLSYRESNSEKKNCVNTIEVENNKIKLLKLGFIKFKGLSKYFQGKIKSVTISKQAGNYYASILVERDVPVKIRGEDGVLGVDMGLKTFVVTSDSEAFNTPNLKKIESKIKQLNRKLARQEKGSNRYKVTVLKIQRLYLGKNRIQDTFHWHLANRLCSENQAIVVEDLNVSGMLKNRKLSHSIHIAGWRKFLNKLEQKAEDYDTQIIHANRWFPSSKTCSACGCVKKDLTLKDRTFICPDCGSRLDRDLNAANNLRKCGFNVLNLENKDHSSGYGERRGELVSPVPLVLNGMGKFVEASMNQLKGIQCHA